MKSNLLYNPLGVPAGCTHQSISEEHLENLIVFMKKMCAAYIAVVIHPLVDELANSHKVGGLYILPTITNVQVLHLKNIKSLNIFKLLLMKR